MYTAKPYGGGNAYHIGGVLRTPKVLTFEEFPSLAMLKEAVTKEFAGIPDGRIQVHGDESRIVVAPLLDEEVGTDQIPTIEDSSRVYLGTVDGITRNGIRFPEANPTMRELLAAVRRRNKTGYPESSIIVRSHPRDGVGTVAEVSGVSSIVFD